jgi:hypothetical protein
MKYKAKNGFIATTTVLIITVVMLAAIATISLLSIGEAQSSLSLYKGTGNLYLAEGCADDALLKAKNDVNYVGGNITRPEGTCTVSVSKNGSIWTMIIGTLATDYKRSVQVIITRNGTSLIIASWKEI